MAYSMEIEVLQITQATDVLSGDLVYQVGFGRIGRPFKGFPMPSQTTTISSNTLIIFTSREKECPYKAGSKWVLCIEDSGEITLKKKENP